MGRESGQKAWENAVHIANAIWLRQKGKWKALGKEEFLWKAPQTEKLKFWLGDGKKNQSTWRRWFGKGSRNKRCQKDRRYLYSTYTVHDS